jgi:hypothetical protein
VHYPVNAGQDLITSMDDAIDQMNKTGKDHHPVRGPGFRTANAADERNHSLGRKAGTGSDAALKFDRQQCWPLPLLYYRFIC